MRQRRSIRVRTLRAWAKIAGVPEPRDAMETAEARVVAMLRQQRLSRQVTIGALAARAGLSSDRVQRVLTPNGQRIHLDELIKLAEALGITRSDLSRQMWPGSRLTGDMAGPPHTESGVSGNVGGDDVEQAATIALTGLLSRSRNWGFAVAPVIRGPSHDVTVRIHNRVTVTPVDSRLRFASHDVLRQRFVAEFPSLPNGVAFTWQAGDDDDRSRSLDAGQESRLCLVCAAFAADRPPSLVPLDLHGIGQRGVVITALRAVTRSLRLSALVARALGWGLLSTGRAGRLISGQSMADAREGGAQEILYANLVLGELLASSRAHTVVNHVGTPVTSRDGSLLEEHSLLATREDHGPFVVYIAESDALLAQSLERPVNARGDASRFSLQQLTDWRDRLREHVLRLQDERRGLVIDTAPFWATTVEVDPTQESQARWNETCQQARTILHELFHLSGMRRSTFVARDPEARALLAFGSPVAWH